MLVRTGLVVVLLAVLPVLAGGAERPDPKRVHERYEHVEAKQLERLLGEIVRFPTVEKNLEARGRQKAWLRKTAEDLGFPVRDAGLVTEVELAGPAGAPVLGLVVHGDVQPVDERSWSFPPFAGLIENGLARGRGVADDKGPLVQALLAMKTLKESPGARTHTIRLLVGSDEESDNKDISEYLQAHPAPDYSLVLDSSFPVVVGEKAWNSLTLTTDLGEREPRELGARPYTVVSVEGGVSPSIVPDRAQIVLRWLGASPDWGPLANRLRDAPLPQGIRLDVEVSGWELLVTAHGRAAHSGMNIEAGRNALVALANLMQDSLPASGANDLLAFARQAGRDLYGTGLRLIQRDPLWGRYLTNVATIKPAGEGRAALTINIRSFPPWTGEQVKSHLQQVVDDFNQRHRARLEFSGYFLDVPFSISPNAKLVQRLLAAYERVTGERAAPVVAGGGTYAKRLPNAIAFGMWFPDKPYPGHDVDEAVPVADLHRGVHVLLEALLDLAYSPRLKQPLQP